MRQFKVPRKTREYRIKHGICSNCPLPSEEGKTLCTKCLDKMRSRTKVRLSKKKESKICARCSSNSEDGKTMCRLCLDLWKIDRRNRIDTGICSYCRNKSEIGKSICSSCSDKRRIEADRKKLVGVCTSLGCKNLPVIGKISCQSCINKRSEKLKELKQIVLNHYNQKCNCSCGCKVTNFRHLTIDHINNDGAKQRRDNKYKGGRANYTRIIKDNFPNDLQVLCWNCNCAKQYYGGCK